MTSVRRRGQPARRGQEALTSLALPNRSDDGNHKDPLGSNKPRPSKALVRPKTLAAIEAPTRPPQAPPAPGVARYTQQNKDHLLQTFL